MNLGSRWSTGAGASSMGTMGDSGVSTTATTESAAVGAPGEVNSAVANGDGHTVGNSNGVFKSQVWWSGLRTSNTVLDAWLVAAAGQIGSVLITLPYSFSQVGLAWGIALCFLYGLLGAWTVYLLVWLYLEFKSRLELQGKVRPKKYILQYYQVIGGLTGRFGGGFTYISNTLTLSMASIIQLVASASNLYYANSSLDKRQWQYIVGGVAFLAVLVPDFGHFRSGAFIGVATTTLTSIYLLIAALSYGQRPGAKLTGAHDKVEFFTGVANVLSAFGGHCITIEILESMKRPSAYKYVCIGVLAYSLLVTLPSTISVYWSAGEMLLTHSNAFSVLPRSGWQTLAITSLIVHQGMGFVLFTNPVFLICEKVVGVHTQRFFLRVLVRIPVVAILWFFALAMPFFGPINSLVGSLGIAIAMYTIPLVAFFYTYRTKSARESSPVQPPWFLPTWSLIFLVNVVILLYTLVIGVSFGTWGAMSNVVRQVHTFGFFDSCFQCPSKPK